MLPPPVQSDPACKPRATNRLLNTYLNIPCFVAPTDLHVSFLYSKIYTKNLVRPICIIVQLKVYIMQEEDYYWFIDRGIASNPGMHRLLSQAQHSPQY